MGSIADKLQYLLETKNAIKNALIAKGVQVSDTDTFRSYADKIASIGGGSDDIITLDSDGMGLTLKAGTYTSRTNDMQPEALSYTFNEDTHFAVQDWEGNSVMLNNSSSINPNGVTTLPTTIDGNTVNNGLSGVSGVTGMTGKSLRVNEVLMTIEYTPLDEEGFYTTDTAIIDGNISNELRYVIGTSDVTPTSGIQLGIKLEEQTEDGNVVRVITEEQVQTYDSQRVSYTNSKTISISGSWYKTFNVSSSITPKTITKGNKLVWTITNKAYKDATFISFAMSMNTNIQKVVQTVNKIALNESFTAGKYRIEEDYNDIWDLGYITMSNDTSGKMVSYSSTNPG